MASSESNKVSSFYLIESDVLQFKSDKGSDPRITERITSAITCAPSNEPSTFAVLQKFQLKGVAIHEYNHRAISQNQVNYHSWVAKDFGSWFHWETPFVCIRKVKPNFLIDTAAYVSVPQGLPMYSTKVITD